jgi:hypothetical protein
VRIFGERQRTLLKTTLMAGIREHADRVKAAAATAAAAAAAEEERCGRRAGQPAGHPASQQASQQAKQPYGRSSPTGEAALWSAKQPCGEKQPSGPHSSPLGRSGPTANTAAIRDEAALWQAQQTYGAKRPHGQYSSPPASEAAQRGRSGPTGGDQDHEEDGVKKDIGVVVGSNDNSNDNNNNNNTTVGIGWSCGNGAATIRVHSLSFSGCGLHVYYQNGAARELLHRHVWANRVYCTSAGVATALFYLLRLDRFISEEQLLAMLPLENRRPQCRSTTRAFFGGLWAGGRFREDEHSTPLHEARDRMLAIMGEVLNKHVPDAHRIVSGRLFVTLAHWPSMVCEQVCEYDSLATLLRVLACATNIPFVTSRGPTVWRGERWVDGGFVDCHPVEDARTVCVTTQPFSQPWSRSWYYKPGKWGEIAPEPPIANESSHIVYPKAHYAGMIEIGRRDAARFVDARLLPDLARQAQRPCASRTASAPLPSSSSSSSSSSRW